MAVQTIEEADAELQLWYRARARAARGQSYSIAGRTYSRQNLDEINKMIAHLERRVLAKGDRPHNFSVANFNH